MSDIFTQDIKDLMKLATTDFDKFYKETEKTNKSSGNCSKAASSGDYSTAASSGDYSTAASSGNYSKAASSGDYSKAASSGDYSTAASSGNYSKAASSGNCSKAASSGDYSTAASSGDYSKAASSGNCSKAASSGDYSTAASSGNCSKAASSGNCSKAASSGDYSTAASSGNYSKAASSGNYSACSALGHRAAVKGDLGNLIMASEYKKKGGVLKPVGGKADIIDGKTLSPNQWYIVENGEWVAVDYTDSIFSRVISIKGDVKKVKTDNGGILFIISNGEHSAHGKTLKQAREDLAFKMMSRDVSQFENMAMSTKKTPSEWALVYRAITGACQSGTQYFIEQQGKVKSKYTLKEILEITKGQYGSERFEEVVS